MSKKEIGGVIALTTKYYPCDDDGAFDEESFRNHISWLIRKGVHAIGVNGGADFDYTDAERKRVVKILIDEVNGRVPCFMGASALDAKTAIKRANDVEDFGADAIFMTGPPPDHPLSKNSQSIVEYYRQISNAVSTPIFIYNTPSAWPGVMPPEILKKIEEAAPLVEYVKAGERTMDEYRAVVNGLVGSRLKVVAGKSYYNFHQLLYAWCRPCRPIGLTGYLPGILPAEHVLLWEAFEKNDIDRAREIWNLKILPLAHLIYGREFGYNEKTFPQEILKQMGVFKTARTPFTVMSVDSYVKKEIAKYIEQFKPDIK